jgi:formylglycine-generating enzyme required for sulfatase activity
MHGNVWTWCQEEYRPEPTKRDEGLAEDKEEIRAITDRQERSIRGGSFFNNPPFVRSACRYAVRPTDRGNGFIGVRPARTCD